MKDKLRKKVGRRTVLLSLFLLLWLSGVIFRLVQLQIIDQSAARERILDQNQNKILIQPKRGTIYDCKGSILARSVPRMSVFYNPFAEDPVNEQIQKISKLSSLLDLSTDDIRNIRARIQNNDHFIYIMRKIEDETAARIAELKIEGIHMQEENKRFYPQGKLAAHLLGRVNMDDVGQSGVELNFQSVLAGKAGNQINFYDAKRRKYRFEMTKEPVDGNDIILTIDETIQYIAEKELAKAVKNREALWGTVIVSQPSTGGILALAQSPTFDPNIHQTKIEMTDRIKAIHHLYDPGSTFKIITISAAVELSSVPLDNTYDCSDNSITIGNKTFFDHTELGVLPFPYVFIHSSNVGTIQIGLEIGEKKLRDMIGRFHFGQRTGIDLPTEEPGLFRKSERWRDLGLASASIGYGISVTPLQMLMALNVIANQGVLIPPRVIKKIKYNSGEKDLASQKPERVITVDTARTVDSILKGVVEEGTGQPAKMTGYTIAGKTGTAQKYDRDRRIYRTDAHVASFAGYVKTDHPLFSIIVVIDSPKGAYYGGQVAAPVFKEICKGILRYYGIPKNPGSQKKMITAQSLEGRGL
ncbi:peptidoglycan D,D-transpeptidase FtsI family protein [Acidobacteriota bacterium]